MEKIGIIGFGEIGKAMARVCNEGGYQVLVRELKYDEIKKNAVDYLHVNIPEKKQIEFVNIVVMAIKELKPKLTIINSSVSVGTTRKVFQKTKSPIVHSPVIGVHPYLYDSIKHHFKKVVGPVDNASLKLALKHFKQLGLKTEVYDSAENSEAAKLLDLVYYAWNIVYCKWVNETCKKIGLNFDQVYVGHNKNYNRGYAKLRPNVVRPILVPTKGPIGGHCTIPDTILFHKHFKNRFTEFILKENKRYGSGG